MHLLVKGLKNEATAVTYNRNYLYNNGIGNMLIFGEFEARSGVADLQAKHERIRCQEKSSR